MRRILKLLKDAAKAFGADHAPVLAAALSYYTILSLAPVLLLLVSVTALIGPGAQSEMLRQIADTVGPQASETIGAVIRNASARHGSGVLGTIIATGAMLLGAGGVFAQLQFCLNRIWNVESKPKGIWRIIRKRAFSMGLFLVLTVMLAVSLAASTALGTVVGAQGVGLRILDVVVSLVILSGLFALVYKYLPDVEIGWREAWVGAVVTAALFTMGKLGIGFYLARAGVASAYGAAGSLVILLLWIYYSSLIVFFGAEVTEAYARSSGRALQPEAHAQPVGAPAPA